MRQKKRKPKILVIHGPNLNLLGRREPELYGKKSLADVNRALMEQGDRAGFDVETFQSNHEGAIIDKIQEARKECAGLIINPAGFTHTSIAIRDALLCLEIPIIEVHISNVYQREQFRHRSRISDIVTAKLVGFGTYGYSMALDAVMKRIAGSA